MTETIRKRLIQIHHSKVSTWTIIYQAVQQDSSLSSIFDLSPKALAENFNLSFHSADQLYSDLHEVNIDRLLRKYTEKKIKVLTIMDPEYPYLLKQIFRPPWVIYAKGDIHLLSENKKIAVVGSRNPTGYGKAVTQRLVRGLTRQNFIIVSGLAKGIDGQAHMQAMKGYGRTIAVLGSGFNHIYPKSNIHIAEEIAAHHLLLSEYPPNREPKKHHFPERNRIIAGLSLGTLVIEAKEKSGSLITAQLALNEGREVFSVPGPIISPESQGTNRLIQEGAKLVLNVEDLIEELPKWA